MSQPLIAYTAHRCHSSRTSDHTHVADDERAASAAVSPCEHHALDALDFAARAAQQVLHFHSVPRLERRNVLCGERLLDRLGVQLQQQRRRSERLENQAIGTSSVSTRSAFTRAVQPTYGQSMVRCTHAPLGRDLELCALLLDRGRRRRCRLLHRCGRRGGKEGGRRLSAEDRGR